MSEWYEVVSSRALEQGDLLREVPVPQVVGVQWPMENGAPVGVQVAYRDLVVLTQSCDLETDKVDEVLVAVVLSYQQLWDANGATNSFLKSSGWRKSLRQGEQPAYCLLQNLDGTGADHYAIADFHHLYSLPKNYLEEAAEQQSGRLRLVAPYREHLAQSFGKYMMRVGLPITLHAFDDVKPA
jgi:hypothetical protein